jgi:hypothetical protein
LDLTANSPNREIAVLVSVAAIAEPASKREGLTSHKIQMAGVDLIFYSSHFSAILIGALT